MCNNFTMMANSAVSDRIKRTSLTNEALRKLLCCSPNLEEPLRINVMEEYAKMLKRSGYSERFWHEVISDSLRGYRKLLLGEMEGGRPWTDPRGTNS